MYKLILHFIIFISFLGLTGCGKNFFKRADVKDVPVNVDERVQKILRKVKELGLVNLANLEEPLILRLQMKCGEQQLKL